MALLQFFLNGARAVVSRSAPLPVVQNGHKWDHAHGTKTAVTVSAVIFTPPPGCELVRIDTDAHAVINTADGAAVDDGTATRIVANVPEIVPVAAGVAVKALSLAGTANIRCTPLVSR